MSKLDAPKLVTALFSFKGKNNDELCFKKGDIITITQTDDGGWWEGTLHDKTGWFPSNYVKEYRATDSTHSSVKTSPEKSPQESPVHQKLNRDIVLKDIIDSERVNVAELQGLVNNFLLPLDTTNVLKREEYKQLLGNIHEVLEVHQCLLANLEAAILQGPASRIGNLFLTLAPKIKLIHTTYCNNHPQAVCMLDKYRDELNEFMEQSGAITPGILVLTTSLSKPFRRLDKYSAMLQELERYTEKNHPDRGDTQRSIAVYREIADRCASIRKQRELALQVLTSGIKGWEGEELNSLGEIIHVGPVTLATGMEHRDRYFVLFPTTLLVLSTSVRMSSFIYEGKLPLTGITVVAIEDNEETQKAFEITGPMIENITVLCATKEERQRWIELLVQEQHVVPLKSPVMSRVSLKHPPYTRLSRFFAKLVRRKIVQPELMKKLLYLQYVLKPDLNAVKMRKRHVTYAVYPTTDSKYNSDSTTADMEDVPKESKQPRKSSTLMLDVRYALDDAEYNGSGLQNTSSLTNFATKASCKDRSTFENSKSLPVGHVTSHVLPNVLLSTCNSTAPILLPRDHDFYRENLDVPRTTNRSKCGLTVRQWKAIELHPKVSDISHGSSDEFICAVPSVVNAYNENTDNTQGNLREQRESTQDRFQSCRKISLHSSDSGMAESYHLHSSSYHLNFSDLCCKSHRCSRKCTGLGRTSHSGSENDENKFENQCICTSPFGSTPRDSVHSIDLSGNVNKSSIRLRACCNSTRDDDTPYMALTNESLNLEEQSNSSESSHMTTSSVHFIDLSNRMLNVNLDDISLRICDNDSEKSTTSISSPESSSEDEENDDKVLKRVKKVAQEETAVFPLLPEYTSNERKRYTQPIPFDHQNIRKKVSRRVAFSPKKPDIVEEVEEKTNEVFTSGLYAHWWLKKNIRLSGFTERAMLCEVCFCFAPFTNTSSALSDTYKFVDEQRKSLEHSTDQTMNNQSNLKSQRPPAEHPSSIGIKSQWSLAALRPAPPSYTLKNIDERHFDDDAIILKLIESYCLTVNARFTVHSSESNSMLDSESQKPRNRASSLQNRGGDWDTGDDRSLSETVRTLKNQMTDLQSQMSLLTKQLDEERRSRLSLAATVKRSMGVTD